jgi:hypothetical protein
MYKYIYCILLLAVTVLLTGCLRTYSPAMLWGSAYPMIIESEDEGKSKFISGDAIYSSGEYPTELVQLFRGSYIIADTRENLNINMKFFGYGGNYKVAGLDSYMGPSFNGNKSVFGAGGEYGMSWNVKINSFKAGLGLMGGLYTEFGEYYSFRQNAAKEGIISSDSSPNLINLSISFFPVVSYQFSESAILSTQLNIGAPGITTFSLLLNNNNFIYWINWAPDNAGNGNDFGRIGLGFMMDIRLFDMGL